MNWLSCAAEHKMSRKIAHFAGIFAPEVRATGLGHEPRMANEAGYACGCRRCLRGELRAQRSRWRWLITLMNLCESRASGDAGLQPGSSSVGSRASGRRAASATRTNAVRGWLDASPRPGALPSAPDSASRTGIPRAVTVSWRRFDRSCAWLRRELLGCLRVGSRLPGEPPGPGVGVPGPFGPGTP